MPLDPETKAKAEKLAAQKEELRVWCLKHPPQVAAVIAVRLGMRVLPFAVPEVVEGALAMKQRHRIVTAFRYLALSRLSLTSPDYALYETCTVFNTVKFRTGSTAEATIFEACGSAMAFCNPRDGVVRADGVFLDTINSVGWATVIDGAGLPWEEIARDREYIDAGNCWSALLNERLWLGAEDVDNAPEPYRACWHSLQRALDSDDPSWKIWADWYEDRLAGGPLQSDEIEYFRLTLIPNGHVKARDTSQEGQLRWKQEINENLKLFRNDARKANRLVQAFLQETASRQNSLDTDPHVPATLASELPSRTPAKTHSKWLGGFLGKYFAKDDR